MLQSRSTLVYINHSIFENHWVFLSLIYQFLCSQYFPVADMVGYTYDLLSSTAIRMCLTVVPETVVYIIQC